MEYIFLTIFIIDSLIHLYASLKKNVMLRGVSKIVILLSLLAFYTIMVGPNNVDYLVVAAILFSWLGDILLIPNGLKWFTAGGISFMASHIFFILAYCNYTNFNLVPWYLILIFALIDVTLVTFIFSKLKVYLKKQTVIPMWFYLLINGAMNCFAIYRLISGIVSSEYLTASITVIGAMLFFVSDTSLFFVRFNKNSKMKTHFVVMSTYILAELLIVLGFIL